MWGARIMFALWAVIAFLLLAAGELSVVGQAKLAGVFGLFLIGWTGGWLHTRRPPPVPAVR
jgi:membrane associated rhomboid family serine protease